MIKALAQVLGGKPKKGKGKITPSATDDGPTTQTEMLAAFGITVPKDIT